MMYRGFSAAAMALVFIGSTSSQAQPNPDPNPPQPPAAAAKGKAKADKEAPAAKTEAAPPPAAPLPDCQSYMISPLEGGLLYKSNKFYFVTPKLADDRTQGTEYLIEVDVDKGHAKRLIGHKGGVSSSLIEHGSTVEAITIMDFSGTRADCGEGRTSGTAIKWRGEQGAFPSFPSGDYAYVHSDSDAHVADLDKSVIQIIDPSTVQRRTVENFPPGSRPLFLKTAPPIALFTYNPKTRELSKYLNHKKTADGVLRLKEGLRLVQDGEKFAAVQMKNGDKTIQILPVKDWSGEETRPLELNLPPAFNGGQVAVRPNFATAQTVVFGKDDAARRNLRQVLLYSGRELNRNFKAPEGSYFSAVRFVKDQGLVMLVSELRRGVVQELWIVHTPDDIRKIEVLKERRFGR